MTLSWYYCYESYISWYYCYEVYMLSIDLLNPGLTTWDVDSWDILWVQLQCFLKSIIHKNNSTHRVGWLDQRSVAIVSWYWSSKSTSQYQQSIIKNTDISKSSAVHKINSFPSQWPWIGHWLEALVTS